MTKYTDSTGAPKYPSDVGATRISDEYAAQLGWTKVDDDYEPPVDAAAVKQQKYSAINAEYSQKISAVSSVGIPVAKQDTLVINLRTQWKAAILSVSKS